MANRTRIESELIDKYVNMQMTCENIAKDMNVSAYKIRKWLRACGIELRSVSEQGLISQGKKRIKLSQDKNWFIEMYENRKMSILSIAAELKTTWVVVRRYLEALNIPIRTLSEQSRIECLKRGKWCGENHPTKNPEIFKKMYLNRKPPKPHKKFFSEESLKRMRDAKLKPTTPLYKQIRNSVRAIKWRKDIFERDEFKCKICGEHTRTLEAHHIISFNGLFKRFEIKTFDEAMEKEELWSLDNGITLCEKCHRETSNYGGRGYNG